MKCPEDEKFVEALLRSARFDAARPGARGRALARLRAEAGGAWCNSREVASALAAMLIVAIVGLGMFGRPVAEQSRFSGSTSPCAAGIESPASSCGDMLAPESGSSSGSLSSSSGGLSGSSSSSG